MKLKLGLLTLCVFSGLLKAEGTFLTESILGDSFQEEFLADESQRVQVSVLNQMGASCGYHALRNGILLALTSLYPDGDYLEKLRSNEHMLKRIGPKGEWRTYIIQERLKRVANKIICEKLMRSLKGISIRPFVRDRKKKVKDEITFNDEKYHIIINQLPSLGSEQEFRRIVSTITNISSQMVPEVKEDGLIYTIKPDLIYEKLLHNLQAAFNKARPMEKNYEILKTLCSEGRPKLEQYLSVNEEEFSLSYDGKLVEDRNKIAHDYCARGLAGDLLEMDKELPQLIEREKFNGLLRDAPVDVALYAGIQEPLPLHQLRENMTADEYKAYRANYIDIQLLNDFKVMRDKVHTGEHFVGVILVYTGGDVSMSMPVVEDPMDLETDEAYIGSATAMANNKHWITLVVIQGRGKRQYIVADSLANIRRLEDPTIEKIIGILESNSMPAIDFLGSNEDRQSKKKDNTLKKDQINLDQSAVGTLLTAKTAGVVQNETVKQALLKLAQDKSNNNSSKNSSSWSLFSWKSMLTLGGTALGSWLIWKTFFAAPKPEEEHKKGFLSKFYFW